MSLKGEIIRWLDGHDSAVYYGKITFSEAADSILNLPSLIELQKDANMWRGALVIFKEILKTDDIEFIKSLAQDMLHPQWGGENRIGNYWREI